MGPITLAVIVLLLFINFGRLPEVAIVLGTLPLALVGGFIALSGVAVEIGVVMLVYLNQAVERRKLRTSDDIEQAVVEGALLRIRPVIMTVAATIGGLLPIMFGSGTGSEVMRRIAAPMVGGMVSATLLTLGVIPALYLLWQRRKLAR